ncbi:M4 family metallopeptidase [Edaphocola aurantiacus]|uniref:M4 family metallopeptidase n=1 Tax=Edaphocola aurantiacus TaxID=2601682 RepID=UPI001C96588E|nr:M4 family metallopeptidase [Edaphocola aurantiacus]
MHFIYKKRKAFLFVTLLGLSLQVQAQTAAVQSQTPGYIPNYIKNGGGSPFIQQNFDIIDLSGWLQATEESNVTIDNILPEIMQAYGFGADDDFVLVRTTDDDYPFIEDQRKMVHMRYNQVHKGVKVEYAELFIHSQNNRVSIVNAKVAEGLNMSVTPALGETQALDKAMDHLAPNGLFSWQDQDYETSYKEEREDPYATSYPVGELIIAKKNVNEFYNPEEFVLAWKFTIKVLNPELDMTVYVDAATGTVIKEYSNIQDGQADLSYGYGTNTYIDTRYRGGLYNHHVLRSNDGGAAIWTKKYNNKNFGGYDCTIGNCTKNSFDGDDVWGSDRAEETTPHWVATQTWNYYKNILNRSSYDNSNAEVKIMGGASIQNAYWSPTDKWLVFGKNGSNHLATKDIVGHEFTHAVTQYTAGLVYQNESGALNESFSDIFGYEVERYLNGGVHTNWDLGEDAWLLRKLNKPSASVASPCNGQAQPSFYHGARWYYGTCDAGGVHTNSGVQNYWFYLLTQGSAGAPDGMVGSVAVNGIGADKARNIAYYNLDNFMGNNSNYNDARTGSILGAMSIYGNCTNELTQTINAWAAVGLGSPRVPLVINGPSFILYYPTTGAISGGMPKDYVASGGNARRYVWTYSGPWNRSILSPTIPWDNIFRINNFNGAYTTTTLKVNDICGSATKKIYFINMEHVIVINPNPVSQVAHIAVELPEISPSNPIQVQVYDLQGVVKYEGVIESAEFTLNVGNYAPGNYHLTIKQGEFTATKQFVKQ